MQETRAEIDRIDQAAIRLFVQESQARTSAATVRTPARCQVML